MIKIHNYAYLMWGLGAIILVLSLIMNKKERRLPKEKIR